MASHNNMLCSWEWNKDGVFMKADHCGCNLTLTSACLCLCFTIYEWRQHIPLDLWRRFDVLLVFTFQIELFIVCLDYFKQRRKRSTPRLYSFCRVMFWYNLKDSWALVSSIQIFLVPQANVPYLHNKACPKCPQTMHKDLDPFPQSYIILRVRGDFIWSQCCSLRKINI